MEKKKIFTYTFVTIVASVLAIFSAYHTIQQKAAIDAEDALKTDGVLEVGGKLFQIFPEEGLTLSNDNERIVLYNPDDPAKIVLYQDSLLPVETTSYDELKEATHIEDLKNVFDVYDIKEQGEVESLMVDNKPCYVTYVGGEFEMFKSEDTEASSGKYSEICVLQDIGATTFLLIRVADYTGNSAFDLISQYVLEVSDETA